MMMSAPYRANNRRKLRFAAAMLCAGILATQVTLTAFLTDSAHADPGNGKGGGSGGGNGGGNAGGNSGGNAGGNSGGNSGGSNAGGNSGGSNAGGNSGGGNAGGNSGGNSNAGGNSNGNSNSGGDSNAGGSAASAGSTPETEIADPSSVLGLRESGAIQPLDAVYDVAEQQLDCKVIDAKLMIDDRQRLTYDLRVVTEDGRVRKARYDAGNLALLSVDDQTFE